MLPARGILVLVGAVPMARLLAIADPRLATPSVGPMASSDVVAKTIVSDKVRFVFLAGLEGSGHHYIMAAGEAVFSVNPDLPQFDKRLGIRPFYVPFAMGESAAHYATTELQARKEMKALAEQAAGLPGPTVYLPDRALSFPFNSGYGKVMQYNDLRRLAHAAELEGLDARVVYLKRSAQDMIIADTVHRHFQVGLGLSARLTEEERFLEYVRIFFTDSAVLQSFLGEIDPGFIVCHNWDSVGNETQAGEIAAFVAPNDEVAGMVATALVDTATRISHHSEDEIDVNALTFDGAESLISRLQKKLDSFEALYCG